MCSFDMLKGYFLPNRNHPRFDIMNLWLGAIAGYLTLWLTFKDNRSNIDLSNRLNQEKDAAICNLYPKNFI